MSKIQGCISASSKEDERLADGDGVPIVEALGLLIEDGASEADKASIVKRYVTARRASSGKTR